MKEAWHHPRLGEFVSTGYGFWDGHVKFPSLRAFTFSNSGTRSELQNHLLEVVFECESDDGQPDEEMAQLAEAIIQNGTRLIDQALQAFWEDLNDRGPDTGMYWHGDLSFPSLGENNSSIVAELISEQGLPVPARWEDLRNVMSLKSLRIRRDLAPPKRWVGVFCFEAAFDIEHGVGILTDGSNIIGIGYAGDADRFR